MGYEMQGVNPWIEVDGGVTPTNAYKVHMCKIPMFFHFLILYSHFVVG
jgi:hypothetical protein